MIFLNDFLAGFFCWSTTKTPSNSGKYQVYCRDSRSKKDVSWSWWCPEFGGRIPSFMVQLWDLFGVTSLGVSQLSKKTRWWQLKWFTLGENDDPIWRSWGCLAGLASSWIGWKMHTAQLPPDRLEGKLVLGCKVLSLGFLSFILGGSKSLRLHQRQLFFLDLYIL